MFSIFRPTAFVVSLVLVSVGYAQHSDIEISLDGNNLVAEPQVVEGEFGEAPNPANVADEPGFEVEDGIFAAQQILSFQASAIDIGGIVRNLWYWNGDGNVSFGPADDDLTVEHPVSAQSIVLGSAGGATTVPGFFISAADDEGGIHQDLEFVLGKNSPDNGVYLFALQLASPGYIESDPVYFVLGSGIEEERLDMAVDYVASNVVVPEPTTFIALAAALAAIVLRRRKSSLV